MAVQIPFPLPSTGFALNSKVRVNLDFLVAQFNQFNSGTATWDNVSIGSANSLTGTLTFYNASNANYLTFQPGVTSPSTTFTLPTAAPAATGFMVSTSAGVMSFVSGSGIIYNGGLFSGVGSVANALAKVSTSGVVTLADHSYNVTAASNGLLYIPSGVEVKPLANALGATGFVSCASSGTPKVLDLLGTTSQVVVTKNSNDFTLSLPQSIATSSDVQFGTVRTGAGTISSTALKLNAANTGIYMASATEMDFVIAGTTYGALDTTGAWFVTGELRGATVRTTGTLKLSNGGSIVTMQALGTSFGDYTLTMPPNDGNASDVLQTDGSGVLTWVSVSAAGGATKALDNLASVAINVALLPGTDNSIALGSASKQWTSAFLSTSGIISATSNQLVLGATRTVTITAPTPATLSRTVTIPDLSASYSIVGTEGAQTINGNKTISGTTNLSGLTASLPLQLDGSKNIVSTAIDLSGAQRTGTLNVANGGTAAVSFTAYSVLCAGATSTGAFQNVSGLGSSGNVLTSNGAGALPTWQASAGSGTVNSGTANQIAYYASTAAAVSGNASFTIDSTPIVTISASGGGNIGMTISNTSVAAGAVALTYTTTGSGDVSCIFRIISATDWALGIDNSDSDKFKISGSTVLGTSDYFTITTAGAVAIHGTATNDSAAAGFVGEVIESVISAQTNVPATGAWGDATSISLTAGQWLIFANMIFFGGTATITRVQFGISTTSGNSSTGLVQGDSQNDAPIPVTGVRGGGNSISGLTCKLTGTTTYYLKIEADYTVATPTFQCRLSAIRIR